MRIPPFNPTIALTIGVISISTTAIFVKMAETAPASIIAVYRLFFAVLLLAPAVIVSYKDAFKNIGMKQWLFCVCASFCTSLYFLFWFESLQLTSVISSVVLLSLQPLFVFSATYFHVSGRFSARVIISTCIAFIGVAIIVWGDFQYSQTALYGDVLALLAALAGTACFVCSQNNRKKLEFIPHVFIVYAIAMVFLIAYNLVIQAPFSPYPSSYWSVFFALAIIPTFLGSTIFNWALKWIHTSTILVAIVCVPISASLLAYFFLHERISWQQWLGGSIVLIGLLLFIVSTSRKNKVTLSHLNE